MDMHATEQSSCEGYLRNFEGLIGDQRTGKTFQGVIKGIIGAESLRASQIARY